MRGTATVRAVLAKRPCRERELFLAVVGTMLPQPSDAIVVLCGEDATVRLEAGFQAFRLGYAPRLVLTGGLHDPPARHSAVALGPLLLAKGVAPDRLIVETGSQETRGQATHLCAMAAVNAWTSLLLVASAYHLPRAFLTFTQAFRSTAVRLTPVAAVSAWWDAPAGLTETRAQLFAAELAKIDAYHAVGHVASYAEGLARLRGTP